MQESQFSQAAGDVNQNQYRCPKLSFAKMTLFRSELGFHNPRIPLQIGRLLPLNRAAAARFYPPAILSA